MRYLRVTSLPEALEAKARLGRSGLVHAGGTDLVPMIRGLDQGSTILDISAVADLAYLEKAGGKVRIGPLVTHARLAGSRAADVLADAAASVGSPQIRAMGTVGGNVCNASPCADVVPALVACGAVLEIRSAAGERKVAIEDFLKGPYLTDLRDDEILAGIEMRDPVGARTAFLKLGRRNACSISRMNFAVVGWLDGTLRDVRVAAGSVAPTARRFPEVEGILEGQVPGREVFDEAGRAMSRCMIAAAGRRWSTPYKEPVAAALTRRVLEGAFDG